MALDDFVETEVAVAVAATAALFSPPVRRGVRRGAVLALAGAITAGEALAGGARAAVREGRHVAGRNGDGGVPEGGQEQEGAPNV